MCEENKDLLQDETAEQLLSEEEQIVLAEQDALDTEAQQSETEEFQEEPTVESLSEQVAALQEFLKKKDKSLFAWMWATGIAVLLLLFSIGALLGLNKQVENLTPYEGLSVGKKYSSYIKLGDYTQLSYTDPYVEPTDEDLLAEVQKEVIVTVKDKLKMGDTAVLDYQGYIDGKLGENTSAEGASLTLGSGQYIDGFESGLVGAAIGETVTLDLTFPEDYSKTELAGKDIQFTVKVLSATRTVESLDALTDALVRGATDDEYTSKETYLQAKREKLKADALAKAEQDAPTLLWEQLLDDKTSTLKKYPQKMYDFYVDRLDSQYSQYYAQVGVTNIEEFFVNQKTNLKEFVEKQIKTEFILYRIAAEQDITVTAEDYQNLAKKYNYTDKAQMLSTLKINEWELESMVLYDKVSDYLVQNATKK